MNEMHAGKQWYAVQLRPRFEKVVGLHLRRKGYEEYLPTYRSRRRWSDRVKEIELPLFPGYIFCKFDVTDRLPILIIPGVVSVVTFGGTPLAVPEQEIAAVQTVVNSGLSYGPGPSFTAGQPVRVEYGPLRGLEGTIIEVKNTLQLIVSVPLLSRSVSVAIDSDCVVPVTETPVRVAVRC
jgi:transcription antitermination factor NusG